MKVKYLGGTPQYIICKSFEGEIKKDDVIEITEKELKELANLQWQVIGRK